MLEQQKFDEICRAVCVEFNIERTSFIGSRSRKYIDIRAAVVHIIRNNYKIIWEDLGALFGKDHSTMINNYSTCSGLLKNNKDFRLLYNQVAVVLRPFLPSHKDVFLEIKSNYEATFKTIETRGTHKKSVVYRSTGQATDEDIFWWFFEIMKLYETK